MTTPSEASTPDQSKVADLIGKLGSYVRPSADIPVLRDTLADALADNRPLDVRCPPNDLSSVPEREWLVDGLLPSNRVTLLTGSGGRGKSRLVLQMAVSLAAGVREWLAYQATAPKLNSTRPRDVVFATYEDEPDEVWRRLQSIHAKLGPRPTGGRFALVDLTGRGPLWAPQKGSRHTSTIAELTPLGAQVRDQCQHADLLILDPLAAVFGSNENDRSLVRAFVSDWDRWAQDHKCAVLMIAHPPKTSQADGGAAYSGSTDWLGAPRSLWTMDIEYQLTTPKGSGKPKPTGKWARYLSNPKNSYGPDGGRVWLIQIDADGAPPVFGESGGPHWEKRKSDKAEGDGEDDAQSTFR